MSSQSVVQSRPITEKGCLSYSSLGERSELATAAPRIYTMEEKRLIHTCDCVHFLTAPLIKQMKANQQMPNGMRYEGRAGRMSIYAFNAVLDNAGLEYRDLGDRSKKKILRATGVYGMPAGKRGPKR